MKRRCLKQGGRQKAFWGAVIPAIVGLAGSIYGASESSRAQKAALEEQKRAQLEAMKRQQLENAASTMNNYLGSIREQPEEEYVYSKGGKRKLRNAGVRITDGGPLLSSTGELIYPGQVVPPGIYKDLGGKHGQKNAEGGEATGWITSNGKRFETEGDETEVVEPNNVKIFSDRLKKNGISYADQVWAGRNPYITEKEQAIDRRRHLRNGKSTPVGRSRALNGATFYLPDYIGLGANILGSVLSNIYATSAYNDILNSVDYELPGYAEEAYVAGPTDVEDGAQRAAIIRNDINSRNDTFRNTASANVGLGRSQEIGTNTMYELMKLAEATRNKNIELRQANAERQQLVRGRNAAARNTYYQKVADIKNQQLATKLGLQQGKIESNVGMIQGIGSSIGGFLQQGIDNYQADQAMRAMIAASPYGTAARMKRLGFKFSDDFEKNLASDAQYVIDKYKNDNSTQGIKNYNDAIDAYNLFRRNVPYKYRRVSLGNVNPINVSYADLFKRKPVINITK